MRRYPRAVPNVAPPPLVAVVGPTAAGKSALGVALAVALGGEVVNADSMQLYRGMDVGTAKLTPAERAGVPHHLLDVLDVTETASVAAYQRLARAAVEESCARGRSRPCWSAGPGSTCRRCWTSSSSRGPTPRCAPGSRPSWRTSGRPRCTPGSPPSTRGRRGDPAEQRPPDRAGPGGRRADRRPVHRRGCPRRRRATTPCCSAWTGRPGSSTSGSPAGSTRMWAGGLVDEVRALARGLRDGRTAAGRWATRRCSRCLRRRGDLRRRRSTPSAPPAGSSAGSARGSVATRASPGSSPSPDLLDRALVRGVGKIGPVIRVRQGPRHGERLRRAARPRRRARPDARPVAALCDRRRGLGADGVLRVVAGRAERRRVAAEPGAEWFMDYRNADGSVAEMCGNGVRVFARYLVDAGLARGAAASSRWAPGPGVREVRAVDGAGDIAVDMGPARLGAGRRRRSAVGTSPASAVDVGNPHLACVADDRAGHARPDHAARLRPALFPHGVNVEFVSPLHDGNGGDAGARARRRGRRARAAPGPWPPWSPRCARPGADDRHVAVRMPGGLLRVASRTADRAPGACGARRVGRAGSGLVGRGDGAGTRARDRSGPAAPPGVVAAERSHDRPAPRRNRRDAAAFWWEYACHDD